MCHADGEAGEAVEVGVWQESSCFFGLSGLACPPPTPFLWAASGFISVGGVTCPGGRPRTAAGRQPEVGEGA